MTVVESPRCPRCGAALPSHDRLDLCPACLLRSALAVEDDACPYQVLAPMAEDARGVTYLAEASAGTYRYVALKVYNGHDDAAAAVSRFRDLKSALAAIRTRGIARLIDVGTTPGGLLYVATEYIPGRGLAAAIASGVDTGGRAEIARQ